MYDQDDKGCVEIGPDGPKCKSGSFLLDGNICTTQCPGGYYQDFESEIPKCSLCNSMCKTCFGMQSDQCSSCRNPLIISGSVCMSFCAEFFEFFDAKSSRCKSIFFLIFFTTIFLIFFFFIINYIIQNATHHAQHALTHQIIGVKSVDRHFHILFELTIRANNASKCVLLDSIKT